MNKQTAYPLSWPAGWPRTEAPRREGGRFQSSLSSALGFLKKEVERLGGKSLVLSSNVTLGTERPADPGVVAYFILREQSIAIPCDRWRKVEDNVKAIGLTIEAMRGMERWGAKHMITAMFKGFAALPERTGQSCWEILEVSPNASEAQILGMYRDKAKVAHPDVGGSNEAFAELTAAKDLALSSVRHR